MSHSWHSLPAMRDLIAEGVIEVTDELDPSGRTTWTERLKETSAK